jgi:hypothetical protein
MSHEVIGEEYVRLALALDQHMPGYVDAYFGPPEWQAQAKTDGPRPLPELAQKASGLAAAIANANTLDGQRKDFLARYVSAMQTSLRLLQGERMALVEEVEALYDVRPTWIDEALFEEAHRVLDELLPSGDTLRERMALRKQALEVSVEQVKQVLPLIHQQFRHLSRARFPLPEDEALDFTFVQNQPWGAYNSYLGRCQSRIEINTDLPLYINALADLVAHEAYPGHHTELSIKESQLVEQAGHVEHSVIPINAPSCVVSEGIATCALTTILPDEAWVAWHAEEIFPRAGLKHLDAQREHMIDQALEHLAGLDGNAAFLLHDQGAEADTVGSYLQHYGLRTEREARKGIEFLSNPLYRSYIFTYYWGKKMLKALFALKQETTHWYARLLTEAVTPAQIRQWMLE